MTDEHTPTRPEGPLAAQRALARELVALRGTISRTNQLLVGLYVQLWLAAIAVAGTVYWLRH